MTIPFLFFIGIRFKETKLSGSQWTQWGQAPVCHDPTMSAKAISEKISEKTSEKFTVTDRTIESDLAHLQKIGILVREGGRKDGYWKIITEHDNSNE